MIVTRVEKYLRRMALAGSMLRLIWEAQPACFAGTLFMQMLQGLLPAAIAWVTKGLFDLLGQSLQGKPVVDLWQTAGMLLIAQIILSVASQLAQPLQGYLSGELNRRLTLSVQSRIYQKINAIGGLRPFEDPRFHNTIEMATRGAQLGPYQLLSIISALVQNTLTLVAFVGVLIVFNPWMAAAVVLAVLPQLYAQIKMGTQRFDLSFQNTPNERKAWYYGNILSAAAQAKELRLLDLGGYFLAAFRRVTDEVHRAQRNQQKNELKWQVLLSFLSGLVSAAMFIATLLQAMLGRLSLGDVTLYLSAVNNIQVALSGLVYALANMSESVLFYTRFTDLLALPDSLPVARSSRSLPVLTKGIELRDVSFRYSETQPWVLRHADLFIPAGKCVALVGLNGAGKTTLVKLLTRLYDPSQGAILWDGIDLREFELADLRRRLGVIFQDFGRYDLSAAENVGLGQVEHIRDRSRIEQAARQAGVHETLAALPHGYETVLSRWLAQDGAGMDLSGGEWQKVAIARMFMREADFLVLDEPTSALDAQAESDTYQQFVELMHGRTSLLISHRFSTVRMADAIAVLENGQITEFGSHAQLSGLGGTYAALYNLQADRYR